MPPVIAAVASAAFTAVAAWTGSVVLATVAYGIAYIGTTIAVGMAVGALAKAVGLGGGRLSAGSLTAASPIQLSRSSVDVRRVIFGRTRVSGTLIYSEETGANREYLHLVIAVAGHECAALGNIYLNEELVTLDGGGNALGTYAGFVQVEKKLGTDDQTAFAGLVSASAGLWTNEHRLRGITAMHLWLKYSRDKFPGGIPNASTVADGMYCWDSRLEDTVWSENPAVCIRTYLTNSVFGLGVDPATEIDEASFIAAANVCDELVTLAAGGTEKRYTLNGCFDLSAEPGTILEAMCGAMAGFVVPVGGKWICQAGAHQIPTITLDENDLRAPMRVQTKLSMRDTCNRVRGTFVSPAENWQATDFTPVMKLVTAPNIGAGALVTIKELGTSDFTTIGAASNAVGVTFKATGPGTGTGRVDPYLGEDGGVEIWRDLSFPFTNSASMAQRLAKIELERTRQDIAATMPCKLTALRVRGGGTVAIDNTRFGWDGKAFITTGLKLTPFDVGGVPALGVDLTVRETAAAVWNWSTAEETTYDPAPNTSLPNPFSVTTPSGLELSNVGLLEKDGTTVVKIFVTWSSPADQHILSGGRARIEFKKHSDSIWLEAKTQSGDTTSHVITAVESATYYDVRVQFENRLGVRGSFATVSNFLVLKDQSLPAAPTSFSIVAGDATNSLRPPSLIRNGAELYACAVIFVESTAPDLDFYEVGTTTVSTAVPDHVDEYGTEFPCPAGKLSFNVYKPDTSACWVWIRAVDYTGNRGTWTLIGNVATSLKRPLSGATLAGLDQVRSTKLVATSSRRYKKNIKTLPGAEADELVSRFRAVRYDHRKGGKKGDFGFIAEEMKRTAPAVVESDEKGRAEGIDYGHTAPILAAAHQYRARQADQNTRRIAALETKFKKLSYGRKHRNARRA